MAVAVVVAVRPDERAAQAPPDEARSLLVRESDAEPLHVSDPGDGAATRNMPLAPELTTSSGRGWGRRDDPPVARLRPDERRLLELVSAGLSVRGAAGRLHVSRRSAGRLLASARRAVGASADGEAVALYARARD